MKPRSPNEMQRLNALIHEKGWNIPPKKLRDLIDGIGAKVDERTPSGGLSPEDRQWVIERVRDRVCGLCSPCGGSFPRHLLIDKATHWDTEILLAYQELARVRALEKTQSVLQHTLEVFSRLVEGLGEYAQRLEEASRNG